MERDMQMRMKSNGAKNGGALMTAKLSSTGSRAPQKQGSSSSANALKTAKLANR